MRASLLALLVLASQPALNNEPAQGPTAALL